MSDTLADAVKRARAAVARGDWQAAYDHMTTADAEGIADPAELRVLGEVAYAAGHLDVCIETWERAHRASVQAGDRVAAAEAAVRVAMHLLFDTALMAPVRGWLTRAELLLEGQDETSAHAWVAAVRTYERLLTGIDEARALGDIARAAQADAERAFLVRELSHAIGLGGRDRRAASASERARVAVTRAIRYAMARVDEHHAELGEHLDRAIRTGTYCAYLPDRRALAGWRS